MQTIDFDKILNIAHLGVRRASVFMGLGVNAAADERLVDYSLTKHSIIRLIPDSQPPEVIANFKTEFGRWVVANGLRELLETFETFLNRLFDACLFGEFRAAMISQQDATKAVKQFDHKGLGEKVALLQARGIAGHHSQHLASLYGLRNCLTHRQGRVKAKDCNDPSTPDCLVATWWAYDLGAQIGDREVKPLTEPFSGPMKESVYFAEEGIITLQIVERRLVVPMKTTLNLSAAQLAEICQFVALEASAYVESAASHLEKRCGIARRESPAGQ